MINSYPKIYAVGHGAIQNLFSGEVIVEEKVDGSQFSFQKDGDGYIHCKSKNVAFEVDQAPKMFSKAVETVMELAPVLMPNWQYRCEYLSKPKHNTLEYERVPIKNLILFDINTGLEIYMSYEDKLKEAGRLGIECVPMLYKGKIDNYDQFMNLIDTESILGGCKIEGVVIKNYSEFTKDKKVAMGKYVSEGFKETHDKSWKERNPNKDAMIATLIAKYRTTARWEKAVQHLRDRDDLLGEPKDIPNLLKEVNEDVISEAKEDIMEMLFKHYWKSISKGITRGLPEWYKDTLAKGAFDDKDGD